MTDQPPEGKPLTPAQQAALAALIAANGAAYAKLEGKMVDAVLRLLSQLNGRWFSDPVVKRVAREIRDVVRDAQEAVGDLTENHLDHVYEVMDVKVPGNKGNIHVKLPTKLRGIDALLEWERPARDARVVRLLGADDFKANEKARERAEQQAKMDLALARREAERQRWGLSEDVIGYRRILRPERSEHGPCALCIVAASRIYHKADLKPLHGGCVCDSLPITKSHDPGFDLNREDLDWIYNQAGGNTREDLIRKYGFDPREPRDPEVVFADHGELGPILVDPRFQNRDKKATDALAKKGLDPGRVFAAQDKIVKKLQKDIADGKAVPQQMLDTHMKWRDEAQRKMAAQADTMLT